MKLPAVELLPRAALRPFVDRLWACDAPQGWGEGLPLLPGTGAELYFHVGTPFGHAPLQGDQGLRPAPAAQLLCVRRQPLRLRSEPGTRFVAVRFRAGMLQRFTPVPLRLLSDCVVDAGELWGHDAQRLLERLHDAASLAAQAAAIESFLLQRLSLQSRDAAVEAAVAALYRHATTQRIEDLAASLGVGRRQLERRFALWLGQTPAEVRGIARLQQTLKRLLLQPQAQALDVALEHGYYDQPHFIRDVQRRTGSTPGALLARARATPHFYKPSWGAAGRITA